MSSRSFILPGERELFARVANGDEQAFTTIFYHYTSRIHPFIQKMTRSEEATEEIVQDVFLNVWKKREMLKEIDSYQSWIFTIATNLTYNYLKSQARLNKRIEVYSLKNQDITNNTSESIDFRESQQLINQVVEQLPPQRKIIYKMSRIEGLSYEEIAQRLNISKHTVKNQLIEALKFIKEKLKNSPGASVTLIAIFIKMYS